MTPLLFLGVAIAGGVGAALRLVVDGIVRSRARIRFPLGTFLINTLGSFAIGLATGAATAAVLPDAAATLIATGLCGGFTTFSTASFETVRLAQERRWGSALLGGLGMLVVGIALAALGIRLGSLL